MKSLFIPLINYFGKKIEQRQFTQVPVYIGGCGRSGTTLLLSILAAHKDIFACPSELNLFEGAEDTGSLSEEILNWYEYATVRQSNALFGEITKIGFSPIGKWQNTENAERV